MDSITFVKSIWYDDFEQSIIRFFDENMALYDLVGEYHNIDIKGNVDDSSINFDLLFNTEEDAKKMQLIVCNKTVCIYMHKYFIESYLNKNNINIKLIDNKEEC